MPWIQVTKPFDFWPKQKVVMTYKPGVYLVKKACADKAIEEGAAVLIDRPTENASRRSKI